MPEEICSYDVRCRTCHTLFKVQLFESHEKNLFLTDKKDWYCEKCKKEYFSKQTEKLTRAQQAIGLSELKGSQKMVSWAVKIRAELMNKADYLKESLKFENDDERELSGKAFERFFKEWQGKTDAKWWIDRRKMSVQDISKRVEEISESIKKK
ncbi:MAG: hypothetical protein QF888_07495 [Desulfobacterales bacterium]|jgi:hypothetical protein|nr:hypothetical protein [Desulfobacterales bacterium]HJO62409.1 hypothetical protein [Desulfobacterales bacterium]